MDRKRLKNPVFLFNAFVLIAFIIFYSVASSYSEGARKFPKFILTIGIVILIFWMVMYFIFPLAMKFIEAQEDVEEGNSRNPLRYYRAWFCVGLSIFIGYLFGFIFLVPTAFISYLFLLGDRKKMIGVMIVMVVITALFYLAFDRLLHIPLLQGLLLDLS